MYEAVECSNRPDVCKKAEFLTHGKQALLWTNLGGRIIVKSQVTDSGKQNGISISACLKCLFREWISHTINSMGSTDGFMVNKFMVELFGDGIHNRKSLFHYFWSYTVTRKDRNIQFHSYDGL